MVVCDCGYAFPDVPPEDEVIPSAVHNWLVTTQNAMASAVRRWLGTIPVQFALGAFGGIVAGVIGVFLGMLIGGNLWFPGFGGATPGYEAAGVFFGLLGLALGSFCGVTAARRVIQETCNWWGGLLAVGVSFLIDLLLYGYHVPGWVGILMLLIPPSLVLAGIRWQRGIGSSGGEAGHGAPPTR